MNTNKILGRELVNSLIGLASYASEKPSPETDALMLEGLLASGMIDDLGEDYLKFLIKRVRHEQLFLALSNELIVHSETPNDIWSIHSSCSDTTELKFELLGILQEISTYAYQAMLQEYYHEFMNQFIYDSLFAIGLCGDVASYEALCKDARKYLRKAISLSKTASSATSLQDNLSEAIEELSVQLSEIN